jgi:hypothetical protein
MSLLGVLFLSSEELKSLTDRKVAKAQINWLKKQSYPFEISAAGKPKVLRSLVIDRLSNTHQSTNTNEPDFDAIR